MTNVLQKVVFPTDRDPDLLPLYADPETWSALGDQSLRVTARAHLGNVLGRQSARIPSGRRVSFASYFNGFCAAYWQHWTVVRDVTLTVRTSGPATILLYRSTGAGVRQRLETQEVTGASETRFEVKLNQYSDGGWLWFDIVADEDTVIFEGAEWTTPQEPPRSGKASLGITTYNKAEYCVETLRALSEEPELRELIDRIFVIDQGDQLVTDRAEYPELAQSLGDQLQLIRQGNLGGSGGFSRAMAEALNRPESEFIQILDDDVRIEPESLRRSIVFGRFASVPTLVGAHMFDLLDRPKLHAWAEVVDDAPFMWRTLNQDDFPHDFSKNNLRQSPQLHARLDSDYNGWWMCLIPLEVIRKVGLSLPAFIKWDDAEFCLRAKKAGYPTVSVPGIALWHVSWVGKDDSIDWQAYFHARNRIVAGLIHSESPFGGTLIRHSRRMDMKHLMMMQYYPTALRIQALKDVLSGPKHMAKNIATAMPRAREIAKAYPETQTKRNLDVPVRTRLGRQIFPYTPNPKDLDNPTGLKLRLFTLRTILSHWLRKPNPANLGDVPQAELAKYDAHWWRVPAYDSVLISAADGSGMNIYRRDRAKFRRMLRESFRLHRKLQRNWPTLSKQYRAAAAELSSLESWQEIFAANAVVSEETPVAVKPKQKTGKKK